MTFALGVVPLVLLGLGFPIFIVLLTASVVALVWFMQVPLAALHQTMYGALDAYALLAIPFFIYAGELMGRGSVAKRLVDVVQTGTGRMQGSLGVTTVGAAAVFGAISGSSAATVATIGRVLLPEMRRVGYPGPFSAGLLTSVGAIGVIIPPSIPLIVYGSAAQESVPRLYAASVFPGLLIAGMLALYVYFQARVKGFAPGEPSSLRAFILAVRRGLWALGAPFIILGGIYGGVFSPTEAGGIACVYSALVTRIIYKDLSWREVLKVAETSALLTSQILIIIACASVFSWLLTVNQVPASVVAWLQGLQLSPWQILLAINLLLLVIGCFFDPLSAILLLSPLLVPIAQAAGVDPVHFGVIVTVNLAIGLFTPPFGLNIFVAQSVLKQPLTDVYRGTWPFLLVYLVALALITYVPQISLVGVQLLLRH